MFRLELDVQDLAAMCFTISPLHEVTSSLWPAYGPTAWTPVPLRPWARRLAGEPSIDHELLSALVSPRGWIPDFAAPPPATPCPSIGHQLAQVRATPPDRVAADFVAAYGRAPLPARLRDLKRDPAVVRDQVADALAQYWRVVIEPRWPRLRTLLEADLLHRGQQLAQAGPGAAFGRLDRRIRWSEDGVLTVNIIHQWRRELPVAGRGLRLVPSLFASFPNLPIELADPPVLGYPARGMALPWEQAPAPPPAATRALLGPPRARLLALLDQPASTTELAHRLGVTPSAVSQHLRVLAAAGLVSRARAGRVVLYQRTETGARLAQPTTGRPEAGQPDTGQPEADPSEPGTPQPDGSTTGSASLTATSVPRNR
jgi:DNA-binding transcriptional ArsR family regulator